MATQETVVEIVRFQERGISEVAARAKAMGQEVDEVSKRQKVLLGLLNDPAYEKHVSRIEGMRKQYELLSLKARNTTAARALSDGSTAKQLASVSRLNKQYEAMNLRARNMALAAGLADGSEVAHLRTVSRLNEEYARMQQRAQLVARYGERWGGFLHRYGGALTRVGNIAALGVGAVAGTGVAMARSGFSGTVEGNRLAFEARLISRELAGIMRPVIELMTKGARYIREKLERLSGGGQNLAMGGLLLGGTAAGTWALRSLMSGGIAARMIGLGGAAAAPAAGAAGLGAAGAAGIGATAAGAGRFARYARFAGPAALAAAGVYAATESSDYTRLRREGHNKVKSTIGAAIGGLYDLGHGIFGGRNTVNQLDEARRKADADAAARGLKGSDIGGENHRNVTLAGGGYEESESLHDRLQAAVSSVGGDLDKTTEERRALIEAINKLNENLARMRERPLDRPGGG